MRSAVLPLILTNFMLKKGKMPILAVSGLTFLKNN